MITFGSVCSGIEAASVAWEPLGWRAAWFAEIEPFPCAVLAHHYPTVPNFGDMSKLPDLIAHGYVSAPDFLCGGTPCQAFSVAGLRKSLDDARGNLSLIFCEIANAIDAARDTPAIIFWENVPGVLNTSDNAFGCFLAGLAGEASALEPPGGGTKWSNSGYVFGPTRTVAWRVLDAQYFGVAQRRRRVFVVASARADFDPAAILFESEGMRRDFAPSRETGQAIAGATTGGTGMGSTNRQVAFGEYIEDGTASTIKARDYKDASDLVTCCTPREALPTHDKATRYAGHSKDRALADGSGNGLGVGARSDPMYTLTAGDRHAVAQVAPTLTSNGDGHTGYRDEHGLVLRDQGGGVMNVLQGG